MGKRKKQHLLANIALLLVTLLAFTAASEMLLRMFFPQTLEHSIFDPYLHEKNIPNFKGRYCNQDYCTSVMINNRSLRDIEHSYEHGEKKRVLFLGDSFTFGQGVEMEQSFPYLLGQYLDVESINGGHRGDSLEDYYLHYRYELSKYDADVTVIAVFLGNDITDQSLIDFSTMEPKAPIEKPGTLTSVRRFLARNSHFYAFIVRKLATISFTRSALISLGVFSDEWVPFYAYSADVIEANIDLSGMLLTHMAEEFRNSGKEVLIVLIPELGQISDDAYRKDLETFNSNGTVPLYLFNDHIRYICSQHAFDCIDLTPAFMGGEEYYYPQDRHWNAEGHELAADTLKEEIEELLNREP